MKKHILVVSQFFYPENFRINDICQEWIKRGHEVTVITGIPNYPEGSFYKGFGWFKRRKEKWNGINIVRLPIVPRKHNKIMLIMNYFSFVISGWFWKVFTRRKADYVFTFGVSPMTQALPAVWFAKKRKIPHYLYVQDLWPENIEVVAGITNPKIIKPIRKMVDYIYRNCTQIFATSPSFVKEVAKRGIDESRIHYWPQYAEEFYQPATVDRKDTDKFKIVFTGNIGYAQGLDLLPRAASILKEKGCKVVFCIVGDGRYKKELVKLIEEKQLGYMFEMIDRQPAENIPTILASCDMAFISFMNNDLFSMTVPAKLQSYIACKMPIVAAATGETKRIVEEAHCGVCSRLGDAEHLAEVIEEVLGWDKLRLAECAENAKKYSDNNFSKDKLIDEMEKYFE